MDNNRKLIQNVLSMGTVQAANYVLPLISVPIIVRIIGPEKYGIINYVSAFVAYFTLLILYGFDLTATRRLAHNINDRTLRNKVFSEVFFCQLILFIIALIIFIPCLFYVKPLAAEKQVTIFSFLICLAAVFTQNWIFQAMQNLSKVAILNLSSKVLYTIFVILLIKDKSDYVWQPLVLAIVQILTSIVSFTWAYKKYNLRLIPIPLLNVFELLYKDRTVFFSVVVINIYSTSHIIILGLLQNSIQVGYYTAGQRFIDIANNIINFPLVLALFPAIGHAFAQGKNAGLEMVKKVTPLILLITAVAGLLLFFMGPTILYWFYGAKFTPSIPAFKIMSFVPFLIAVCDMFGIQVMINLKMDKEFFYISAGGAVLGILLSMIIVQTWGYIGAAWTWLAVELSVALTMYFFLRLKGVDIIELKQFKLTTILSQCRNVVNNIK